MVVAARQTPNPDTRQSADAILPSNGSFPILQRLLESPDGPAVLEELTQLIQAKLRPSATRAPRLRRNLFARLRPVDGAQYEIGVVRDISLTGVRVKFLRSATLDIIRNEQVVLETRLPSKDMVTILARMVRVASSTDQHIELAFHFAESTSKNQNLLALLKALEQQ